LRPEKLGASAEFLRLPLIPGEKTQAVWDYSEHAMITQGQLLEKRSKNAIFCKLMWKTPLFKRLSRLRQNRGRAILRESRVTTRNLESSSHGKRNGLAEAGGEDFKRCRAAERGRRGVSGSAAPGR
jgi:hypothetical protein